MHAPLIRIFFGKERALMNRRGYDKSCTARFRALEVVEFRGPSGFYRGRRAADPVRHALQGEPSGPRNYLLE